jgi:hypothetical protein
MSGGELRGRRASDGKRVCPSLGEVDEAFPTASRYSSRLLLGRRRRRDGSKGRLTTEGRRSLRGGVAGDPERRVEGCCSSSRRRCLRLGGRAVNLVGFVEELGCRWAVGGAKRTSRRWRLFLLRGGSG